MCSFVTKIFTDGRLTQTKYEVLKFVFEDAVCWCFQCRAIEIKFGKGRESKIFAIDSKQTKDMTFPKKKYQDFHGKETLLYCDPPPFYEHMKQLAVDQQQWKVYDDEAPPIGEENLHG